MKSDHNVHLVLIKMMRQNKLNCIFLTFTVIINYEKKKL